MVHYKFPKYSEKSYIELCFPVYVRCQWDGNIILCIYVTNVYDSRGYYYALWKRAGKRPKEHSCGAGAILGRTLTEGTNKDN